VRVEKGKKLEREREKKKRRRDFSFFDVVCF
jgi:hypothetical protein